MKKLLLIIAVATIPAIAVLTAGEKKVQQKVVPKGKTFVQLDAKNKEVARFKAGQSMGIIDCAEVPCPSTFGKDVVCWKCKERPATNTSTSKAQ
jgi:hypothetical protein